MDTRVWMNSIRRFDPLLVAMLVCAPALPVAGEQARDFHIITSFELQPETETLLPGEPGYDLRVRWVQEGATHGRGAAEISFATFEAAGGRNWPHTALNLGLTETAITDWSDYRRLELDVINTTDDTQDFGILLNSERGGVGPAYRDLKPRGTETFVFDLAAVGRQLDSSRMQSIQFWKRIHLGKHSYRPAFLVDHIRLIPKVLDQEAVSITVMEPRFRGAFYVSHPVQNVRAMVVLDFPSWERNNQAEAVLIGADNSLLGRQALELAPGEQAVTFALPAPPSPDEVEQLILRIVVTSPAGEERLVVERALPVHKAAPDEVTVDEHNRLLVNGRPFFPISVFNPPLGDLGLHAAMGFNCVGPYISATPAYRAEAKKHGLRLMVNSPRDEEEAKAFIDSGVILGYYMYDEPPAHEAAKLRSKCLAVAALDPYHPTTGVNNYPRQYPFYTDVADVMMIDSYPLPGALDEILERIGTGVKVMQDRRPVWYVPQAHNLAGYQPMKSGKEPAYHQMRSATWLGLVQGVRGLAYYSASIQTYRMRDAYPNQWLALGYVVREVRALHDMLLWPMRRLESETEAVHAAVWQNGDQSLVAVVNAGTDALDAAVTVPVPGTYRVVGENRDVSASVGRLTDHFEPQSVHLYANWPLEAPLDVLAARKEYTRLRGEHRRTLEDNVALCWRGAKLAFSSGASADDEDADPGMGEPPAPALHIIDGYRGANWPLGFDTPSSHAWSRGLWKPNRSFQVTFANLETLDRAVVVTANVNYKFAVYQNDAWHVISPDSEEPYTQYLGSAKYTTVAYGQPHFELRGETGYEHTPAGTIRTFPLTGIRSDRVRLLIPDPPQKGKPEVYYEIEVYRAGAE